MKLTHHTKHPCRTLKEKLVWTDPLATYGSSTRGGRLSVFCKCSPFTSANPRRREMTRNTPIDAILNVEENTCDMGVSGLQLWTSCMETSWVTNNASRGGKRSRGGFSSGWALQIVFCFLQGNYFIELLSCYTRSHWTKLVFRWKYVNKVVTF